MNYTSSKAVQAYTWILGLQTLISEAADSGRNELQKLPIQVEMSFNINKALGTTTEADYLERQVASSGKPEAHSQTLLREYALYEADFAFRKAASCLHDWSTSVSDMSSTTSLWEAPTCLCRRGVNRTTSFGWRRQPQGHVIMNTPRLVNQHSQGTKKKPCPSKNGVADTGNAVGSHVSVIPEQTVKGWR